MNQDQKVELRVLVNEATDRLEVMAHQISGTLAEVLTLFARRQDVGLQSLYGVYRWYAIRFNTRPHHYIGNRRQENSGLGRIGVSGQTVLGGSDMESHQIKRNNLVHADIFAATVSLNGE